MFSKPAKAAAPTADETIARRSVVASLIAENVVIEGDLVTEGEVQLDGALRGDLKAGRVYVGERGRIDGAVEADLIEVRGRVCGSISARSVKLHASAWVEGDVTHAQLAIEAGAHFAGRSLSVEPVAEPPVALIAAAE